MAKHKTPEERERGRIIAERRRAAVIHVKLARDRYNTERQAVEEASDEGFEPEHGPAEISVWASCEG